MAEDLGFADLHVIPNLKGFRSKLNAGAAPALDEAGRTGGSRFGGSFGSKAKGKIHETFKDSAKYIVGPLVGAIAIEKIGELIGDSIRGAIEDQASGNRAKLVFGPLEEEIAHFSESASKSFGLSDNQAKSASASFGLLFRSAGQTREEAAKNSIQFTKLGADFAAFGNTDPEQAFTALQRGLAGSTRGLKPYGILIDGAQQKAEALRLGLLKPVKDQAKIHTYQVAVLADQVAYNDAVKKSGPSSLEAQSAQAKLGSAQESLRKSVEGTVPALTAQQKVIADRSLILQQSRTQQGQFGRSSGELAQQQKILAASFDNAKDRLGKGLLPIVTDLVTEVNKHVIPAIDDFSTWFEKRGAPAIHRFEGRLKPLVKSALPTLKTGLRDAKELADKLLPAVKGIFDAFNKLPDFAQKAVLLGATGAYVAKKSGLLSAGTKALGAGGILGSSKPIPVFVTNEGFGGPGSKGPGAVPVTAAEKAAATEAANAEKVSAAAREAALAVKAAGGGAVAQSIAAARAGKAAAAELETALEPAFRFGKIIGGKGLLKTLLSPAATFTLGDKGNEVRSNGTALYPTAADFKRAFAGSKTIPSQDVLSQFGRHGFSDAKAANLLGLNHLKATSTDLDALRANLGKTSTALDLIGTSSERGFGLAKVNATKYGDKLRALPIRVQTAVLTPGLLKTSGDVDDLARKYHLTPKQVRTIYRLDGIEKARHDFDALQAHMGRHTTFEQQIELTGPGQRRALDGVHR